MTVMIKPRNYMIDFSQYERVNLQIGTGSSESDPDPDPTLTAVT